MSRQVVIGLEVHVQVASKSKLFCSCSTDYIGALPNTHVCPVCLGLPGALPVPNRAAVEAAVLTSFGLGCRVAGRTRFHRKNYFYPDLPKAYQISQFDLPIGRDGEMELPAEAGGRRIRIERLHLEEDAGKLVHGASDGRLAGSDFSLVDYNRGGVPLMEIVSQPDLTTPQEAREYVVRLRQLVRYLGVSDGDMENGSLRADANVSLSHPDGSLGTKVEIKNLNSLRSLERALEYEILRQGRILDEGGAVVQETRHWDDGEGVTRSSREKEAAHDYRYFPDPDLPPLVVEDRRIEEIRLSLPELPWEKRRRFEQDWGLSPEDAAVLAERREVAEFFEACVARGGAPKSASLWVRMDLLRLSREEGVPLTSLPVLPDDVVALGELTESKELSATAAKAVLDRMVRDRCSLEEARKRTGIGGRLAGEALSALIRQVLEGQQEVLEEIRSGKDKKGAKLKFLQGLVMRAARGQADPQEVGTLLQDLVRGA